MAPHSALGRAYQAQHADELERVLNRAVPVAAQGVADDQDNLRRSSQCSEFCGWR